MTSAVIVDCVRSPIGRGRSGGALSSLHPVELLAQVLTGLVDRTGIDPGIVDDVIVGCVSQAGEQAFTPGRLAWLAAGYPEHVPATTIDRRCGSSLQALSFAAQGVQAGAYDVAIAGGVEVMSRVPMGSARMDADVFGPSVISRYAPGLVSQGVAAELVAADRELGRDELDAYSARSHQRAAEAAGAGRFNDEIIQIEVGDSRFEADETIRPGTTADVLATLDPVFRDEKTASRFPEIAWSVTAGNSSQISDGASAALVMDEALAERLDLHPLARIVNSSVAATDPVRMLTAPMPAARAVLDRSGVRLEDVGHIEVNEAFASVPLAFQRDLGVDDAVLNPLGGAIALGHPLGATGTRLLATMLHSLHRTGARYGLEAVCENGGMANALLVENL